LIIAEYAAPNDQEKKAAKIIFENFQKNSKKY
jgi:hypothetical protein